MWFQPGISLGLPTPICSWGNMLSWCLLLWGSAGERCMTRRLLSNVMTCDQMKFSKQAWLTRDDQLTRWLEWSGGDVFLSSQPNLQFPVPTRPSWRIQQGGSKQRGTQKIFKISTPHQFKFKSIFKIPESCQDLQLEKQRKKKVEFADIIQPKHLPSALLYLSIVLFWLLSHLCLLYCSESEIDHSHLSSTSINVE